MLRGGAGQFAPYTLVINYVQFKQQADIADAGRPHRLGLDIENFAHYHDEGGFTVSEASESRYRLAGLRDAGVDIDVAIPIQGMLLHAYYYQLLSAHWFDVPGSGTGVFRGPWI